MPGEERGESTDLYCETVEGLSEEVAALPHLQRWKNRPIG